MLHPGPGPELPFDETGSAVDVQSGWVACEDPQTRRRSPEGARHADRIPLPRPRATHGGAFDPPQQRNRDRDLFAPTEIPTRKADPPLRRCCGEAITHAVDDGHLDVGREREGSDGAEGTPTHRGDVGHVRRHRLPPSVVSRAIGEVEVQAFHEHVDREEEILPGTGEDRGVVASPGLPRRRGWDPFGDGLQHLALAERGNGETVATHRTPEREVPALTTSRSLPPPC